MKHSLCVAWIHHGWQAPRDWREVAGALCCQIDFFNFGSIVFRRTFGVGICRKNTMQTDSKNNAINGFSRCILARIGCLFYFPWKLIEFPHIGEALRREENLRDGSIEALLADNERQEAAIELHTHTLTHEKIAGLHWDSAVFPSFQRVGFSLLRSIKMMAPFIPIIPWQRIAFSGADDASMLSVLKRKQSVSCIAQLR